VSDLKRILEAVLFASAKPVTLKKFQKGLPEYTGSDITNALNELVEEYVNGERGVEVGEVAGGFQMRTKLPYRDFVRRFVKEKEAGLTRAMLETLAIIAYRQPISKREVDGLRGVDSVRSIRQLLERRLVEIAGRNDEPGKPMVFRTTARFLETFGLKDVKDLPTIKEIEGLEQ
jgi:segregation and condensation protein B